MSQREPSPAGGLAAIALFQTVHGLSTEHHGVACRQRDVLRKAIPRHHTDAMSQRAVQAVQFCRHG